jgi:hypothetical protein
MPDPTRATTVLVVARSHAAFRTWYAENQTERYTFRYADLVTLRRAPEGSAYLALEGWGDRPNMALMVEVIRDRTLVRKVLAPDGSLAAYAPVPSENWRIFQEYLVGQVMAAYGVAAQGIAPYPTYTFDNVNALRAAHGLPPMEPDTVQITHPTRYSLDEVRGLPDATRREAPVYDTCAHVCGGDADHVCEARAVTNLSFTLPTGGQRRMPVCQACYTSEKPEG